MPLPADSNPSTSGASTTIQPADSGVGEQLRQLALAMPCQGVATNTTVAMLPLTYWDKVARELRQRTEMLARQYVSYFASPPPTPTASPRDKGASASGPTEDLPLVDIDKIMSLTERDLAAMAQVLGVSQLGQTFEGLQTSVITALLDEQVEAMQEAVGASASGSTQASGSKPVLGASLGSAPVLGASASCSTPPPPAIPPMPTRPPPRSARSARSESGSAGSDYWPPPPPPPLQPDSNGWCHVEETHPNPLARTESSERGACQ